MLEIHPKMQITNNRPPEKRDVFLDFADKNKLAQLRQKGNQTACSCYLLAYRSAAVTEAVAGTAFLWPVDS